MTRGQMTLGLTLPGAGRMHPLVAICYRIAGHVKQAAKEVKGNGPGTSCVRGFFMARPVFWS